MANIQVKNVPEKLHNRLRRYAREQDCTLNYFGSHRGEKWRDENGTNVSRAAPRRTLATRLRSYSNKNGASATVIFREPLRYRRVDLSGISQLQL